MAEEFKVNHAHYFKRNAVYKIEEDTVSIVDVQDSNTVTQLDPWMARVVLLADGQHTIAQLIQHLAAQYADTVPDALIETIESVITRLSENEVIELTSRPSLLPYYLRLPIGEQDPKEATKLMFADGFLTSTET